MKDHEKHNKEAEESITRIVNEFGWYVAKFEATEYLPSFAYTIGLWKNYNHPELIIFGLTPDTLHNILNIGGDIAKAGDKLIANQESDELFDNSKAYILEVNQKNLKDYFGYGIWFNEGEFPVHQIVWTDKNHKFPWAQDFQNEFTHRQPLLDRNFEFKFREDKNLGVLTNRHFLEEGKPILYVEHDDEGDWTFLTGDDFLSSDARLIWLEDIIEMDKSLNELFNLDYGESAQRKSLKDKWIRNK